MTHSPERPTAHQTWRAESVPPGPREALLGTGRPYELVVEKVLGVEMTVFAHRPHTARGMLERSIGDAGDQIFLVSPTRSWTYRDALVDIDAVAVLLAEEYGVGAGDRVAIASANSAEYAIMIWAVLSLGAVVTSLNGWWTASELEHGVATTEPVLLVGDERRIDRVVGAGLDARVTTRLLTAVVDEAAPLRGRVPAAVVVDEDQPAIILFTSGTTGRPKGAALSHRNVVNFAMVSGLGAAIGAASAPPAAGDESRPQPGTIVTSPMFHISGLVATLVTGPVFRVRLVFPPPGAWDAGRYLELTERHRVTMWSGVPTHYWRLLRHPDLGTRDVSSVSSVGSGGAVFPPELVRALDERFPGVRLGNGYGMSETVGLGTQTSGDLFVGRPDAVGVVLPTVELQVRDGHGAVLPEGEVGEIHLRHPSVFLGYWNDPEATAAVLDGDRWCATGDFGRLEQGMLFLATRRRDLILRGGENIYPIEIENRLVAHPGIDDAAVIGVDHVELGQEVKAFVVLAAGATLSADDVRAWCADDLAAFKVPREVEFREVLPYTDTGKLLKQQLEQEERTQRAERPGGGTATSR